LIGLRPAILIQYLHYNSREAGVIEITNQALVTAMLGVMSLSTVKRSLKELKERGLICVELSDEGVSRISISYTAVAKLFADNPIAKSYETNLLPTPNSLPEGASSLMH
jgi:hypothetical protein